MAHLPKHTLPRGNFRLTPRGVDVEVAGALVLELEEGGEEEKEEKKKKKRRLLLFLSEFGVGLRGGRRRGSQRVKAGRRTCMLRVRHVYEHSVHTTHTSTHK